VILEELGKLHSHPTAAELYAVIRRRLPRISLGTVYRNLGLLAREGLVLKLDTGGAQKRFDGNPRKHCHIRCIRCGRIDDLFEDDPVPGVTIERIGKASGYEIRGHRVSFTGICPACGERAAERPEKK